MNFLKNNLCNDVCCIINDYLMINKDTVYENKKLVIEEITNVIDLNEYINQCNKEYTQKMNYFFNNNKIDYYEENFLSVMFSHINGEYD